MASGHALTTDTAMRHKGFLLVAEAARKINVTPSTIYRWIANTRTRVTGFRDGYRRYVSWESILAHLGPEATKLRDIKKKDIFVETPS